MEQLFWQNNGNSILQHMQRFEDILIMSLRATERSVAIDPKGRCEPRRGVATLRLNLRDCFRASPFAMTLRVRLLRSLRFLAMTSFLRFLAKISNASHKSRENYNYCRGLIYQTRKNGLNKLSPYSAVSK